MWLVKLDRLGVGPLDLTGGLGFASAGAGEFVDDVLTFERAPRWGATGLAVLEAALSR